MYQIKVRWNPDTDFHKYDFKTKSQALAFQYALKELILVSKSPIVYEFQATHPHYIYTILATLLVSLWTVIWWHVGAKVFPTAIMTYTDLQIAICSGLAYLVAKIATRWFDD